MQSGQTSGFRPASAAFSTPSPEPLAAGPTVVAPPRPLGGESAKRVRILHLERQRQDTETVRRTFEGAGLPSEIVRVDNRGDFLTALRECGFDLILADYFDPDLDGFSALTLTRQKDPDLPVIFLTTEMGKELAVEIVQQGASDVVLKHQMAMLPMIARRILAEAEKKLAGQPKLPPRLTEPEQRFRQIADGLHEAFWMIGLENGRLLCVNEAFVEIWGVSEAEIYTSTARFTDSVHVKDRESVAEAIELLGAHQEFQLEFRILRPDGMIRWIWNRSFPIRDANGQVHHLVSIAEDITERKLAEERLQQSADQLSAIFKAFPDDFFILEADGGVLEYHLGDTSTLFSDPESFLGRRLQDALPSGVAEQFTEAIPRVLKTRAVVTLEYSRVYAGSEEFYEARFIPLLENQIFVCIRSITDRKQGEKGMRESQGRMSNLIDALPGIVFSSANDEEWSMTYLSEGVVHLTGYKREELLRTGGTSFHSIIDSEDGPKVRAAIKSALETHQPYVVEYRIRTKSGKERWLWEKGRGVFDREGNLFGREGFITDITERKRVEAELNEQSNLLRGVAAASTCLLTEPDVNTAIQKVLRTLGPATAADRVYIYENRRHPTTGEVVIQMWSEWTRGAVMPSINRSHLHNQTYATVGISRWQKEFSAGRPITGLVATFPEEERRLLCRDDIVSIILVPIILDQDLFGFIGFDDCLLERKWTPTEESILTTVAASIGGVLKNKRSKEALQQAEEKYRSIFENAFEGIFQTTPAGRYLSVNPALARMYGYDSPKELMASIENLEEQIYVDPTVRQDFQRRMETDGAVRGLEYQIRRRDGKALWIQENSHAVRDPHGHLLYYEGIIEDITDRKIAEERLRESNHQLETALNEVKRTQKHIVQQERLHALGQMSSGIAHDFNNALMSVLGFSELLLMHPDNLDNKPKVRSYLETINTAARDASNVVKRLSEFYRHREEGEVFPPIEINGLVTQVVTLTQPRWKDQAQASGLAIEVKTDLQPVPLICGNAAELRECLTNLILNAVDAMPHGGTITLRTWATENHVRLEVGDTGTGMTEEVRKRCLEPFFSTKGTRGTGLGLAMVFGIVQRHQGTLDIQSEVGTGTRFTISLPAEKTATVKGKDGEAPERPARPLSILVVDDEPLVREVLVEYLQCDGHTVITACDGREGLQRFGEQLYDIVLTDKSMPNMSGDHLAAAIKQVSPRQPIILLTGFGEMMKASGQKPEGVDVVMSKPISLNALRRTLAEAVA